MLLAHVLLAWGLVEALGPTPNAPPVTRAVFAPIHITLLAEPPTEPAPGVATTVRPRPSTRATLPRARPSTDAVPRPAAPAPITLPAPAPVLPAERDVSAPPAPARLDLRLPPTRHAVPVRPPSAAEQALQAQVGNTRITRPEALLARRLEDRWTEELQDGRVVLRRGEDCVVLAEARALQLDPANNRGTMPRGAGNCAAR